MRDIPAHNGPAAAFYNRKEEGNSVHKVLVICAILTLLPPRAANSSPLPDKPLSVCEQYNQAGIVFLGKVVARDQVETIKIPDPPMNRRPGPGQDQRFEHARVAVVESFGGPLSGEVLIGAPFRGLTPEIIKLDPAIKTGSTYLFYATGPGKTRPGHFTALWVAPAEDAALAELRRLSRMTTGSIRGTLTSFTISEPWQSTFLGRVLDRHYLEVPSYTGKTTSPTVQKEVVRVAVVESFWGDLPGQVWIVAPDAKPQTYGSNSLVPSELVRRFEPALRIGETYLFRAVDGKWSVVKPENFSGLLATVVIPIGSAPVDELRRISHSPEAGHLTVIAKAQKSSFEARADATPSSGFEFADVPPGTYSFVVEHVGFRFEGPWSAEVRAGGCAVVHLRNTGALPLPQN